MNRPIFQKLGAFLKNSLWGIGSIAFIAISSSTGILFVIGIIVILIGVMLCGIYIFRKIFLNQEVFERFLRLVAELTKNKH